MLLKERERTWINITSLFIYLFLWNYEGFFNYIFIIFFITGFYKHPERHSSLLHLLHEEVGDIVYTRKTSTHEEAKPCYELTIDEIRKNNKFLIILYPVQELPYPESGRLYQHQISLFFWCIIRVDIKFYRVENIMSQLEAFLYGFYEYLRSIGQRAFIV